MAHIQLRDIVTFYEETGSGPLLVLIAGLGGHSGLWSPLQRALSLRRRVITFDNRGAGRTSAPDKPYSIAGMADDVAQLLERLEVEQASVVGYGMGGAIALELAATQAERVESLVLIGTAASVGGRQRLVTEGWVAARRSNLSREQTFALTAPWLYSADLLANTESRRQAVESGANDPHPAQDHAYARQAQAFLAYDASANLSEIAQPTLVIAGEEDMLVDSAAVSALADALPNGTLQQLGGGHAGLVEEPGAYTSAILDFLGAPVAAG